MNERLEAIRKAAEHIIQVRRGDAVDNIDLERAHAWFAAVAQQPYEPPAIDITEEEYIAMYRSQDPDYAEPKQVVIGDVIMMPSGVRYRVNLPPKRVQDEPIPF